MKSIEIYFPTYIKHKDIEEELTENWIKDLGKNPLEFDQFQKTKLKVSKAKIKSNLYPKITKTKKQTGSIFNWMFNDKS